MHVQALRQDHDHEPDQEPSSFSWILPGYVGARRRLSSRPLRLLARGKRCRMDFPDLVGRRGASVSRFVRRARSCCRWGRFVSNSPMGGGGSRTKAHGARAVGWWRDHRRTADARSEVDRILAHRDPRVGGHGSNGECFRHSRHRRDLQRNHSLAAGGVLPEDECVDSDTGLHYNFFRDYDPQTGRYVQADPIGLAGGINLYAYVNGNPVTLVDPTGEAGIPGAVYGAIAGGVSGYISSGGSWRGAAIGGLAGGAIGFVNPWSSTVAGSAAGSVFASAAGQVAGNYVSCQSDPWNVDWTLATVSGLGSGAGRAIGNVLAQSNRSAFSYMVSQSMGAGNQAALQTTQAAIRGSLSGFAQYGYKGASYPAGYPQNQCGCTQ